MIEPGKKKQLELDIIKYLKETPGKKIKECGIWTLK